MLSELYWEDPRSEIYKKLISDPRSGSRVKKKHQIPDQDPQHCFLDLIWGLSISLRTGYLHFWPSGSWFKDSMLSVPYPKHWPEPHSIRAEAETAMLIKSLGGRCCKSGFSGPVLRIQDVYPGSELFLFWIPKNKRRKNNKFVVFLPYYIAINFIKF